MRLRGEQRDADACAHLFSIYDDGRPTSGKTTPRRSGGTLSARERRCRCPEHVGFMYLMGKGIRKDRDRAVKWLRAATDNGCAKAMCRIGRMYDEGLCNTDPDLKSAMTWYQRAADAGDPDAQFALGCIYSMPQGKYFDDREATRIFGRTAENGHVGPVPVGHDVQRLGGPQRPIDGRQVAEEVLRRRVPAGDGRLRQHMLRWTGCFQGLRESGQVVYGLAHRCNG